MNPLLIIAIFAIFLVLAIIAWQLYQLKTKGLQPETANLSDVIEPKLERSAYIILTTLAWLISLIFLYFLLMMRKVAALIGGLFSGAEKRVGKTIGQTHRLYQVRRRRLISGDWWRKFFRS